MGLDSKPQCRALPIYSGVGGEGVLEISSICTGHLFYTRHHSRNGIQMCIKHSSCPQRVFIGKTHVNIIKHKAKTLVLHINSYASPEEEHI